MRIRDVALKTCQRRCIIRRSGERGSGISVLAARHDDDDDGLTLMILFNTIYLHTVGRFQVLLCHTNYSILAHS